MPLYEYQCTQCSDRVELIQKMSAPGPDQCAKCGGAMKKLFSSPAIQFKGSGFYKTDYASASSAPPASGSGSESKGESKGESAKSDSPAKSESSSSESSSSSSSSSSTPSTATATKSDS